MAIDHNLLSAAGYLLHGPSDLRAMESIARHGILPGDEVQRRFGLSRTYEGDQASRDGHMYMGTREHIQMCADQAMPVFRINTTLLDPNLVCADEDHFAIYTFMESCTELPGQLAKRFPETFRTRTCKDWGRPEYERAVWQQKTAQLGRPPTYKSLGTKSHGDWASKPRNAAFLAREDVAAFSLWRGSIAYNGVVAPQLLSIDRLGLLKQIQNRWSAPEQATVDSIIAAVRLLEVDQDFIGEVIAVFAQHELRRNASAQVAA